MLVGPSNIAGRGCFMSQEVQPYDFIAEFTEEMISQWEANHRGAIYDQLSR